MIRGLSSEKKADLTVLPDGYSIVNHDDSLVGVWCSIQTAADQYHSFDDDLFFEQFPVENLRSERIFYIVHNGIPIATAACWFGGKGYPDRVGRLHWVAVLPDDQNCGLGTFLVKEALERFRSLRYHTIFLSTNTVRVSAIALYLKLGFRPQSTELFGQAQWRNYLTENFGERFCKVLIEK